MIDLINKIRTIFILNFLFNIEITKQKYILPPIFYSNLYIV